MLLENWGSGWCEWSSGRDFKAAHIEFKLNTIAFLQAMCCLLPSISTSIGQQGGRRAVLGLRQPLQWVDGSLLVVLEVYMGVNVYRVCVSGVSPGSSVGMGSGMQGASSSLRRCLSLGAVLVRSNNKGSLPARLLAVPARMTLTLPFSYVLQAGCAEPFLTWGPASSSSCSPSCRGCSWAREQPLLITKAGSCFAFEPWPILFLLFFLCFPLFQEKRTRNE